MYLTGGRKHLRAHEVYIYINKQQKKNRLSHARLSVMCGQRLSQTIRAKYILCMQIIPRVKKAS